MFKHRGWQYKSMTNLILGGTLALASCGEPPRNVGGQDQNIKSENSNVIEPETSVDFGSQEKKDIEEALQAQDWELADRAYRLLARKDLDLGTYPEELEAQVLEMVRPLPAERLEENYLGYDLLSSIVPNNEQYSQKAETYKAQFIDAQRALIGRLNKRYDKVAGITWYRHSGEPTGSCVCLYIGQKTGRFAYLRMKTEYTSRHGWLFVEKVTAWYDGKRVNFLGGSFERRNTSRIWEWRDVSPTSRQIETLRLLANADEAILRFEGENRNFDLTLTSQHKQVIRETLDAFEAFEVLQKKYYVTP